MYASLMCVYMYIHACMYAAYVFEGAWGLSCGVEGAVFRFGVQGLALEVGCLCILVVIRALHVALADDSHAESPAPPRSGSTCKMAWCYGSSEELLQEFLWSLMLQIRALPSVWPADPKMDEHSLRLGDPQKI